MTLEQLRARRRRLAGWSRITSELASLVTLGGILVLMPLWLPVAFISTALEERRLRKSAGDFQCRRCGVVLGAEAVALADAEWQKRVEELFRKYPGMKFRMVRTVRAICTRCGTNYSYSDKERAFAVVEANSAMVETSFTEIGSPKGFL